MGIFDLPAKKAKPSKAVYKLFNYPFKSVRGWARSKYINRRSLNIKRKY